MARTRSKGGATASAAKSSSLASTTSRYTLPAANENPEKLFVLPERASSEARVVSLPNPRTSKPARYLVCPTSGIYEFTKVSAPRTSPRSWLLEGTSTGKDGDKKTTEAQITKSAELYVASSIDPVFLVLPALAAQVSTKADPPKRMFLSSDDHFESLPQEDSHMSEILRWEATRKLLESRMAAVCDTVEAGDESMFRLNEDKLVEVVLAKAKRLSEAGLPKSLREKFVTKALEAPVSSVRSTQAKPTPSEQSNTESGVSTPQNESADSQSSVSTVDTATSAISAASTAATSVADETEATANEVTTAMQASPEIVNLQSLKIAFNFICSRYVPPILATVLKEKLSSQKTMDMAPLEEYTTRLAKLRQEATLARSASDFSRKRNRDEEDEERAEKRRKKEEEEKRKKANESRGVRDLKKVNVSGMKKMSDFFKKKT